MFLEIQNLDQRELKKLEMMFGERLSAFHNIHYQVCVEEMLCVLENNLEEDELRAYMEDEMFGTNISELAQELYAASNNQWDDLYEIALEIFDRNYNY